MWSIILFIIFLLCLYGIYFIDKAIDEADEKAIREGREEDVSGITQKMEFYGMIAVAIMSFIAFVASFLF